MVKPQYKMTRQATLDNGHNVTLGTAQKTDRLYPYPTDADTPAVVTRDFEGGSMIVDNGNLTIDNITLDGNKSAYTSTENGGIVRVNGRQTLTITGAATLRNSVSEGDGGAIWLGESAALVMYGSILNCQANNGGGVYATDGFGGGMTSDVGVNIGGTISGCMAAAGSGGAIYASKASTSFEGTPVTLTASAALRGNSAVSTQDDDDSGRGGALYCATDIAINGTNVSISNNTAKKDGGAIYQSSDSSFSMNGGTVSGNVAETGNGGGV
jgi:predicted outer membrane repeat protein